MCLCWCSAFLKGEALVLPLRCFPLAPCYPTLLCAYCHYVQDAAALVVQAATCNELSANSSSLDCRDVRNNSISGSLPAVWSSMSAVRL
jgi:hypothetical protein